MFTRNFTLVLLSNIILGAPMPMLIILGGLAGAYLSPVSYAATLPPSIQMLAGVIVAAPISLLMGRRGRKVGFLLATGLLICGGILGVCALFWHNFILLCMSHALLGGALVGINFFRFAAAEAVPKHQQSKAISYTLASGLVAAIIGPELFSYSKDMLAPVPFAGAYSAIVLLGITGAIPVLMLQISKAADGPIKPSVDKYALFRRPKVIIAISGAAVSQAIMVLLMVPTAIAMVGCGFDEDQAADVIKWHVIAMFAPGFITGGLIQKFGALRIVMIGLVLLASSSITAMLGVEITNFYGALVLLGIGWNFGFIGSTHLLQSSLAVKERPMVQGVNDTIIAIVSSAASLLSGALYFGIGWSSIAVSGLVIILIFIIIFGTAAKKIPRVQKP